MDKQKQIDEIKKYMRCFCVTETVLKDNRYEVEKEIEKQKEVYATALYNAGYRKIPENAVVLTKEEWAVLHNDYAKALYEKDKQARKETAEKFAERAKEEAFLVFMDEPIIRASKIDEICKEITEGNV